MLKKLLIMYVAVTTIMSAYSFPLVVVDTKSKIITVANKWEADRLNPEEKPLGVAAMELGYTDNDYAELRKRLVLPELPNQ